MIKIILKENKKIINEISVDDAVKTIESKATRKIVWKYYLKRVNISDLRPVLAKHNEEDQKMIMSAMEDSVENYLLNLKGFILACVPNDINDNQKGLSAAYIKKWLLYSYDAFEKYIINQKHAHKGKGSFQYIDHLKHLLEGYFKFHDFVLPEERDIMNLDFMELGLAVEGAAPKYQAYLDKKQYGDAEAGTEIIYEDDQYKIFIPNNRGAACQLGKGTRWCTAAPGTDTDYYAHYHKEDDPLFIIYEKPQNQSRRDVVRDNPNMQGAIDKYQFHYGSEQFMTVQDEPLLREENGPQIFREIDSILKKTVGDRFPIVNQQIIVDTDIGFSIKKIRREEGGITDIDYRDTKTGYKYGGSLPSIRIEPNDLGDSIFFEWQGATKNPENPRRYSLFQANEKGPDTISIRYVSDESKFYITVCTWRLYSGRENSLIASYRLIGNHYQFDLRTDNLSRWQVDKNQPHYLDDENTVRNLEPWTSHFEKQFKNEIENDPDGFALRIIEQYLPEDIKKEYGL